MGIIHKCQNIRLSVHRFFNLTKVYKLFLKILFGNLGKIFYCRKLSTACDIKNL